MLGVQQLFLLTAIYRGLYCYGGDQSKKIISPISTDFMKHIEVQHEQHDLSDM